MVRQTKTALTPRTNLFQAEDVEAAENVMVDTSLASALGPARPKITLVGERLVGPMVARHVGDLIRGGATCVCLEEKEPIECFGRTQVDMF